MRVDLEDFAPGLAPRDAALEALLAFDREGAFVSETLARATGLEGRDRGLAMEMAAMAVRAKALLDHHLSPCLRGPTAPELLWILRLALVQVLLLDRVPAHAAGDLAVRQARRFGGRGAAGFVNAVLRRSFRAPLLPPQGDSPEELAITFSHPEWLVRRWVERHGLEATLAMLEAGNAVPPAWVRVRPEAADLPWDPGEVSETAHGGLFARVEIPRERILSSRAFARGDLSLQDPASGEAALLLAPHLSPGQILVDLCAAPGGKLACLRDAGALEGVRTLAFDLSAARQRRTREGFERLGIRALVAAADGCRPPLRPGSVDRILLDAPCSNLGVLSRRPEARWRALPGTPAEHGCLQAELLASALERLKPGGLLVYSTCSVEPEETDDVLSKAAPGAELLERRLHLPRPGGWDGFFAALLRKS